MAVRKGVSLLDGSRVGALPETFWYTAKRRLLGPPMINAQLREQRLSKFLALGVLSPDGISSSAYGTEEILIELIRYFGIAAFAVLTALSEEHRAAGCACIAVGFALLTALAVFLARGGNRTG